MNIKSFLGYLEYRYCEEIERHSIHVLYENKEKPGRVATIPLTKSNEVHPYNMYDICNALGVNMPEEYRDLQMELDRLRLYLDDID